MTLCNYIIITFITIACLTIISCDRNKRIEAGKTFWLDTTHLTKEEKIQRQVWTTFRQAVISKNITAFRKLSLAYIQCPDCYSYLPISKTDTSGANECVNVETFVSNGGFESAFNNNANKFYFNYDNIGWINAAEDIAINQRNCFQLSKVTGQKVFEISINDRNCAGEECSQTIFSFAKTDKGYKFSGMENLP